MNKTIKALHNRLSKSQGVTKYYIEDWAGNTCFHGKTFESFEDADAFLSELFGHLTDERYNEERDEYYIALVESNAKQNQLEAMQYAARAK